MTSVPADESNTTVFKAVDYKTIPNLQKDQTYRKLAEGTISHMSTVGL
jgi:hypothetical protein